MVLSPAEWYIAFQMRILVCKSSQFGSIACQTGTLPPALMRRSAEIGRATVSPSCGKRQCFRSPEFGDFDFPENQQLDQSQLAFAVCPISAR
jgi:hypothetical protein